MVVHKVAVLEAAHMHYIVVAAVDSMALELYMHCIAAVLVAIAYLLVQKLNMGLLANILKRYKQSLDLVRSEIHRLMSQAPVGVHMCFAVDVPIERVAGIAGEVEKLFEGEQALYQQGFEGSDPSEGKSVLVGHGQEVVGQLHRKVQVRYGEESLVVKRIVEDIVVGLLTVSILVSTRGAKPKSIYLEGWVCSISEDPAEVVHFEWDIHHLHRHNQDVHIHMLVAGAVTSMTPASSHNLGEP